MNHRGNDFCTILSYICLIRWSTINIALNNDKRWFKATLIPELTWRSSRIRESINVRVFKAWNVPGWTIMAGYDTHETIDIICESIYILNNTFIQLGKGGSGKAFYREI